MLISPALPVIALFTVVLAEAEPVKKDTGIRAERHCAAGVGARAGGIQEHSRGNAKRLPAAIVVVNVPVLLIALTLIELGTLAAAAYGDVLTGVVKSAA